MEEAKYEKLAQSEEEEEIERTEEETRVDINDHENTSKGNDDGKTIGEKQEKRIEEIKLQSIGLSDKRILLR